MQLDCGLQALGDHMGTYTTNKELFMPSVGETGWGDMVNNNFSTIDTYLKPISLSGSTYTFTGNQTGGSISATSITNSGTLTNTGKITANGGIAGGAISGTTGTFSGAVACASLKQTSNRVINVSGSSNWITASFRGSGEYDGLFMCVLPFEPNTLYTGSLSVRGGTGTQTLYANAITSNNTYTTLGTYSSQGTVTFSNIRALYVMAGDVQQGANIVSIPILSYS